MTEVLTAAQMRAVEAAAIKDGVATGSILMERAGIGVVTAILETWPELRAVRPAPPDAPKRRAMILCGPGNNGGDGFVIARELNRLGWEIDTLLFGTPASLPSDAREKYEAWLALGPEHAVADATKTHDFERGRAYDLIVDALFGTGLTRPISDPVLWERLWLIDDAIDAWETVQVEDTMRPPRTVAVDLPSGLCADSGKVLGQAGHGVSCAQVQLTVTFHRAKRGHVLGQGPKICGALKVIDIGLGAASAAHPASAQQLAKPQGHKYQHGASIVLTGGAAQTGAARLAARAALRVGAGVVTLAAPGNALMECAMQSTAVMVRRCDTHTDLDALLLDQRITNICVGPGFGMQRAHALIPTLLNALKDNVGRSAVFDADALTAIAQAPALFEDLSGRCVLTPHAGEFARLFPDIFERLEALADTGPAYSKMDATLEAAVRTQAVVLFKGPDTVIAAPDGRVAVCASVYEDAVPWLATAGAGDVLAGVISGLLARGFDPFDAAETGAWLHRRCAQAFGAGLIAEDLVEMIPVVLKDILDPVNTS